MSKTAFTAAQVERALRGAMRAGLPVHKVEITTSGSIIILPNLERPASDATDKWFAQRGDGGAHPDDRD